VLEKGAKYWDGLREWNEKARKLTMKELGILEVACAMPRKIPTEKQCLLLIEAENRAKVEGFYPS
jgi:hypothetical protein